MQKDKMKAVVFATAGESADVLQVCQIDTPRIGPGAALVKVDARPVQPADFLFIGGRYRIKPQFPQIAGLEGSGVVVVADSDESFQVGTRVAFRYPGSWAEYVSVPTPMLYLVPEGVAAETAAQFSLNPVTAYGLLDELSVRAGDCIAINAATSSVALIVESLARRRNIKVIGIVRKGHHATLPFETATSDAPDLAAAMLALSAGRPFTGLLDSIGGSAIKDMLPAMRQGATIVSFGVLEQTPVSLLNADMIYRNLCWKGFGVDYWLSRSQDSRTLMIDELWKTIQDSVSPLPLLVRSRYSLDDVLTATNDVLSVHAPGKVILTG